MAILDICKEATKMKYELVVIWSDGQKEIHEYPTYEDADSVGRGYKIAFGNQVSWYGVRAKA